MVRASLDRDSCAHNHRLHYGSGLPVFRGDVRQEGWGLGGLLGGLFRQAIPILKPMASSIAKAALKTSGRVLSDVVSNKKPLKDAVKDRFLETIDEALTKKSRQVKRRRGTKRKRSGGRRVDILD